MNYICVVMDKREDMFEQLCDDLNRVYDKLKRTSKGNEVWFTGNVSEENRNRIISMCAMSPYSEGYKVYCDGKYVW